MIKNITDRNERFNCEVGKSKFALTGAEYLIAELLAKGYPRKTMADKLHISVSTVDFHLVKMRKKAGVETTLGLAIFLVSC
jgi:DNA-binding CsgD family transcriptional regulator